eukprot:127046-Chlamydomonas_euryale.AAC.1
MSCRPPTMALSSFDNWAARAPAGGVRTPKIDPAGPPWAKRGLRVAPRPSFTARRNPASPLCTTSANAALMTTPTPPLSRAT